MSNCPICSGNILRHIRNGRVYWYCHHCFQEVPDFERSPIFETIHYESDGLRQIQPLVSNRRS
ncbi:MAG: hypothetical protein MUD14_05170 [Hydrococcus sp. Prado102]|jgi:ribosomal protein L37AE/L43A|nr:hypothetical protein [Hydrococcus sp. Prado102]